MWALGGIVVGSARDDTGAEPADEVAQMRPPGRRKMALLRLSHAILFLDRAAAAGADSGGILYAPMR